MATFSEGSGGAVISLAASRSLRLTSGTLVDVLVETPLDPMGKWLTLRAEATAEQLAR